MKNIVKENLHEQFKEQSDPIRDMKIGIDDTTIEGFLTIHGFDKIKIERRWGRLPAVYVKFHKDGTMFEFEMIADDDTASTRHCLEWTNSKGFDYQPERWTLADPKSEKDAILILKRRLNRYYKQHSQI